MRKTPLLESPAGGSRDVSAHHRGLTNDQVQANYHAATEDVLYDVGVDKHGLSLLLRDVSAGPLKVKHAKELVGADQVAQLTRENILTVNPSTRLVTFNSRHIQTFFTETGVLWPIVCSALYLRMNVCACLGIVAHCHVQKRATENSKYADIVAMFLRWRRRLRPELDNVV